jgi:O-antigen/teichoic acid export membrane protein
MRWLLVAGTAFALHAAAHAVLYAKSRVDVIAKITIVEGIANVVLSLALGYRYGAPGPAFATALTVSVATVAAFIPWACRTVDLPLATLVRDIASHATIPLVAITSIALALRQLLPGDPIVQCSAAAVLVALCAARLPVLIHASPRGAARPRPVADAG